LRCSFFTLARPPPTSTLFPYTTLFRSLSSTFHLGNPQRAWRALSPWRSSWLSREGVLAILTFVPLVISAWFAVFESTHLPLIGLDRKSTRLNSSHVKISYAVFCLKKKK